jgi:hypothetical protein
MTYTITNLPTNQENKSVKKSSLYGLLGSALSCIILFLIMWFYVMPYASIVEPVEEEGLMISFGNSDDGGGQGEELMGTPNEKNPAPSSVKETTTPKATVKPVVASTTPANSKTSSQDYITQSETSLAIAEKNKQNKERLEQQAIENARIANEKRVADQKRKEQAAINKANSSMNGLFGNSTSAGNGNGTGTGSGTGPEHQGNPAGKGYSGGSYGSVSGRAVVGKVVEPDDIFQEGKAIVSIRVNPSGKVIYAKCTSGNISDNRTKQMVESAAYATKFSTGNNEAVGTIVYNLRYSSK